MPDEPERQQDPAPTRLTGRLVLAGVIGLIGAVWIGQGAGLIGGSSMTDDRLWAWIGAGAVALAVVIGRGGERRGP